MTDPSPQHPLRSKSQFGFTLIEILIAIAIFAFMSAMAYGGLAAVLNSKELTDQHSNRLAALQTCFSILERDAQQTVNRPVRDNYGDLIPAIRGGTIGTLSLELTHGGWVNPLQHLRSTLQRVAYQVKDGKLLRLTWPILDRAPETKFEETELLEKVESVEVKFLDSGRNWQNSWPPLSGGGLLPPAVLPVAIEVTLQTEDWGPITRLFLVAGS